MATTEEVGPKGEAPFPWVILVAAAAAIVLLLLVVGVVVARSGESDDVATAAPSSSTTAVASSSTTAEATTTIATTTRPPSTTVTTTRPVVTTTVPPKPVGVGCPSEPATYGTVLIRDDGDLLNFRPTPERTSDPIDQAAEADTIEFWTGGSNVILEDATYTTWLKARLPSNPESCAYVSAVNVRMDLDALGDGGPPPADDCITYDTTTAAVHVCPNDGQPTFDVVWKARPAAGRRIGPALPDGGGWKAQPPDAAVLYHVDNDELLMTQHGKAMLRDSVGTVTSNT